MKLKLHGLIAAPFTPMHADGRLNGGLIREQADSLARNSVNGAFICGTTGEGLSLTTAERIEVAESWLAAVRKRFPVIVHVGHNTIGDSQTLAAHAERISADAIAAVCPTFFRVTSAEILADYCARIAQAAPALPFYYYHIPSLTGVSLPMVEFLRFASRRIPNFNGIKFTDEDLMSFAQCLDFEQGRFNILFGRDEILLAALVLGATGAVGSTYNYMAPVYHKIMAAVRVGDLHAARELQMKAIRVIGVTNKYGGLVAGKAMMSMIGLDCGPMRPPLQCLSEAELERFRHELECVGFSSLVSDSEQPYQATVLQASDG